MKELLNQCYTYIVLNLKNAAPLLIAGAIGAIIKRLRYGKMTPKRFIEQVVISAFLAWCLGVTLQYWLKLPNEVIYAIVSLSGMFHEIILDELEEVAGHIKEWISMRIESWIKKPKTK
jgi:hypothetical protein